MKLSPMIGIMPSETGPAANVKFCYVGWIPSPITVAERRNAETGSHLGHTFASLGAKGRYAK
jgi:hypothetical protein